MSPVERKNGWQPAEEAGAATPGGVQRRLATADGDADAVRDDPRVSVVDRLGDADAVLVVGETGVRKEGAKSVGVQRRYGGTAGRIENRQVGVFLTDASAAGRAFLDRALYLPQGRAEAGARRAEAGVPREVVFRTEPHLATAMLERALVAGVPAAWVTGGEVYGGDRRLRLWLEEQDAPHVLAVKRTEPMIAATDRGPAQVAATELVAALPSDAWATLSAGAGAKGPRIYDRAPVAIRPLSEPGPGLLVAGAARPGRPGPLRLLRPRRRRPGGAGAGGGAAVGRLAPPRHPLPAGARLPRRDPRPRRRGRKRGAPPAADLLPPTVPEVRRLLCRPVWGRPPPPAHTLGWSVRRRRHQARATRGHYRRRLARRRDQVRLSY